MPLTLLLQDVMRTFQQGLDAGGYHLNDWDRLVAIESLLVARAQSAFLVHWFGPRVPLQGFHLRIAIENLPALRARYQQVVGAGVRAQEGPNLTEPLAGMVGTLFGSLSSPINAMFLYERLARIMPRWYTNVAAALSVLSFSLLGTLITALVGGASVLLLPGALTSDDAVHVYNLLGAVARMANPFRRFWEVISGPRERVQNPVLRGALRLADQLAQLFPYVIALVAFLVTRLGPAIETIKNQLPSFMNLATAVIDLVQFLFKDLKARFLDLGPKGHVFGALKIMIRALRRLPKSMKVLGEFMGLLKSEVRTVGTGMMTGTSGWIATARPAITAATTAHPFFTRLTDFKDSMITLAASLRSPPPPPPPLGTAPPPPPPGILETLAALVLPPVPSLSVRGPAAALGSFGRAPSTDVMGFFTGLSAIRRLIPGLWPNPLALSQDTQREVAAARRNRSVFEPIVDDLELANVRAPGAVEEQQLRDLLFEVLARSLPPAAYDAVAPLENIFNQIDDALGRQHPVRDLAESKRLQPVVSRLRVRARADSEPSVRAWAERLRAAMETQNYLAPAST